MKYFHVILATEITIILVAILWAVVEISKAYPLIMFVFYSLIVSLIIFVAVKQALNQDVVVKSKKVDYKKGLGFEYQEILSEINSKYGLLDSYSFVGYGLDLSNTLGWTNRITKRESYTKIYNRLQATHTLYEVFEIRKN